MNEGRAGHQRSIIAIYGAQKRTERDGFNDGGVMLDNGRSQGAA
jgi:hypothetical protein